MKQKTDKLRPGFLAPVKFYRLFISPYLAPRCRYHPTCSAYTERAIKKHGFFRGLALSLARILRCHPWTKCSRSDPVPEEFAWRGIIGYKRTQDRTETKQ